MAVIINAQNEKDIMLKIDNGDLAKMNEVLQKWNFKDIQSFWRFSISILLQTEEKKLWIQENGNPILIAPADHSIKG